MYTNDGSHGVCFPTFLLWGYTCIKFEFTVLLADTTEDERSVSALTGADRTTWAKIREQYFSEGVNKHSLHTIEKAIFCVNITMYKLVPYLDEPCPSINLVKGVKKVRSALYHMI